MYNEKAKENDCEDSATFVASTGWLQKFMRRNGLSLGRKTSVKQKDPSRLIDKLASYIFHICMINSKSGRIMYCF